MAKPSSLSLFLPVLLAGACGRIGIQEDTTDLSAPYHTRCELLEDRAFSTRELQTDCGPAPASQQITCRWRVRFTPRSAGTSDFVSHSSDVGEGGTVTCAGDAIFDDLGRQRGTHDPSTDILVWDGREYEAQ